MKKDEYCLYFIKRIAEKLIQTLVMKRKIPELKAHKTPWKFFYRICNSI